MRLRPAGEPYPPYSAAWWRWARRWAWEEFRIGWRLATSELTEDAVTRQVESQTRTQKPLRTLAVWAAAGAIAAGASGIHWSDSDAGNLLAEVAGVLLSVAVALILVDALARRERAVRYAELTWVSAETALDVIERAGGRIAAATRLKGEGASFELYFRGELSGGETEADREARFWRSRKREEADWHLERMRRSEERCAKLATGDAIPSRIPDRRLIVVATDLERLERVADRLAGPAADDDATLEFVRLLWRAADQRHHLAEALALYEADGPSEMMWDAAEMAVHFLRRAYESGRAVAAAAGRATGRNVESG